MTIGWSQLRGNAAGVSALAYTNNNKVQIRLNFHLDYVRIAWNVEIKWHPVELEGSYYVGHRSWK